MTGEIAEDDRFGYGIRHEWDHEGDWMQADQIESSCVDQFPYYNGYIPRELHAYSSQSQEHANKLAIEARQFLIRKIDFSLVKDVFGQLHYPERLSMILCGELNPFKEDA